MNRYLTTIPQPYDPMLLSPLCKTTQPCLGYNQLLRICRAYSGNAAGVSFDQDTSGIGPFSLGTVDGPDDSYTWLRKTGCLSLLRHGHSTVRMLTGLRLEENRQWLGHVTTLLRRVFAPWAVPRPNGTNRPQTNIISSHPINYYYQFTSWHLYLDASRCRLELFKDIHWYCLSRLLRLLWPLLVLPQAVLHPAAY